MTIKGNTNWAQSATHTQIHTNIHIYVGEEVVLNQEELVRRIQRKLNVGESGILLTSILGFQLSMLRVPTHRENMQTNTCTHTKMGKEKI